MPSNGMDRIGMKLKRMWQWGGGGGGGNRTSQDRTAGLMRAAVLEIDVKTFAFA